jgi:serine/threonine protein kinase
MLGGGVTIGSYSLVKKLGAGGMGEVWLAKHQLLSRPAAVKLIRSEAFGSAAHDDELRKRFRREAQATAKLRSPHTVELYDFGVSDEGAFYYVMECLNGMDLEALIKKFGPLPVERVIHFLKQACLSLGEAHAAGLVHRDIKPANLFTCQLGTSCDVLKVLDFGMVKREAGEDATQLTAVGSGTGTPAYLAPESALDGQIDGRTDIYSLGCVAFWLLTGSRVFNEDNVTKMVLAHVQGKPPKPSELSEVEFPAEVDDLVLKCLAKNAAERPASAEELWRLLDAVELESAWTKERAEGWWVLHAPEQVELGES